MPPHPSRGEEEAEAAPLRTPGSLWGVFIKGPGILLRALLVFVALARVGGLALMVVLPTYTFFAAWRLGLRAQAAWRARLPARLEARAERLEARKQLAYKWADRRARFDEWSGKDNSW
jgi:hypothetical protein